MCEFLLLYIILWLSFIRLVTSSKHCTCNEYFLKFLPVLYTLSIKNNQNYLFKLLV